MKNLLHPLKHFVLAATGLILATLALSSCSRGPREPTEAEMRAAVQAYIDGVNRNIEKKQGSKLDRNDPLSPFDVMGAALLKGTKLSLVEFKKLSAGPAPDGNGYIAFYDIQIHATGNAGSMWNRFLKTGSRCRARFIQTADGWVWIPPTQE